MAKQALLSFDRAPILQQVAGEGRGRSYELSIDEVKIGRSEQNDIVIPHESVSREHAHIEKSADGEFVIFDNGSKNGLIVNGTKLEAAPLKDGDVFQIGVFAFKFRVNLPLEEQEVSSQALAFGEPLKEGRGPRSKRPILYGGMVLVLATVYWYSNQTPESEVGAENSSLGKVSIGKEPQSLTDGLPIRSASEKISSRKELDIPGLEDPTLKAAEQDLSKLDFSNQSIQEAELYFRRGQREYFNKNWHRAIDAFNTSLAIYRKHPLADFYLRASIQEAEREAKTQMEMAIKYYESLQYKRSIYHFEQVMALLVHRPNEKVVADCQKYIDFAKKKLQASELFP